MNVSDKARAEAKSMILDGYTDREISKALGIPRSNVCSYRRYMRERKGKPPAKKKYRYGELDHYFAEGKSIDEVMELTGLKRCTVSDHYKFYSPCPSSSRTKVKHGRPSCEPNTGVRFTSKTNTESIWKS